LQLLVWPTLMHSPVRQSVKANDHLNFWHPIKLVLPRL